jgi:hypothetical protein
MKNMVARLIVLLALTVFGAGISWAANGAEDGSGPIHDIFSGTPFDYTGAVAGCVQGEGLILDVDNVAEDILISGVGPRSYWESIGVERPAKGDTIRVVGYTVAFEFEDEIDYVNIATEITIGDDVVPLRDDDGYPLWVD